MRIAVPIETEGNETRVAATPETVKKFIGLGATVTVQSGAGTKAGIPDSEFETAGAKIATSLADTLSGAEIVLGVRRPSADVLAQMPKGAAVIATMDPYGNEAALKSMADAGVDAFAMEFMPRITRAQVMDILSSQANLAGYQAVIDAAGAFDRAMPMMMTAAGTVRPAKVFVMGAGVAGLQAIATAKRLGAVVTATDVRAAAGEQVESLGAKFIMTEALKDASGSGGYARELTNDEQAAQAELVAGHIAKQDIVITTALIPGRPAPKLVSRAMVESMAPGSVLVDLAAERGGNIELTQPGKTVTTANGATIIGFTNVAGRLATSASQLYSRNLVSFLETLVDKKEKALAVNWDDELVKATVLTRDGAIVHPNIKFDAAPAPAKPAAKAAEPAKTGATGKATAPKRVAAPKAETAPAAHAKTAAVAKPIGGKVKKAAPIVAPIAKAAAPKKAPAKPAAAKPAAAKSAASTAKGKK